MSLTINKKGLDLIIHYESIHDGDLSTIELEPKMDCSDIWTEGYGEAMIYKGKFLKGLENEVLAFNLRTIKTVEEAKAKLAISLTKRQLIVSKNAPTVTDPDRFSALVSYVYNTGGSDTMWKLIRENAPMSELQEWWEEHYITSGGVIRKGLIYRRKSEFLLYSTGELKFFN